MWTRGKLEPQKGQAGRNIQAGFFVAEAPRTLNRPQHSSLASTFFSDAGRNTAAPQNRVLGVPFTPPGNYVCRGFWQCAGVENVECSRCCRDGVSAGQGPNMPAVANEAEHPAAFRNCGCRRILPPHPHPALRCICKPWFAEPDKAHARRQTRKTVYPRLVFYN